MDLNKEDILYSLYISELLFKANEKKPLTDQEQKDLDGWRRTQQHEEISRQSADRPAVANELRRINYRYDTDKAVSTLFDSLGLAGSVPGKKGARVLLHRRWLSAAAIFLLFLTGAWLFLVKKKGTPPIASSSERFKNDRAPGSNKATLTLSNGSTITLDTAGSGMLARQGNVSVLKSDSGKLSYNILLEKPTADLYNTVSTPPGGQYRLTLSDGTAVWLDASSSLHFPVLFSGRERTVELKGQAYFEVARNEQSPFSVKVGGASVQVLGTHFNINAYADENAIRTTLLEGSVKVTIMENKSVLLQPGQQAQLTPDRDITIRKDPDLEEVMAWKNGIFQLRSAGIRSIMRQAARWYDVEIKYEGGEVGQTFYGTIPRSVSAINLFKVLEEAGGVHFKIDGRTVTVSP